MTTTELLQKCLEELSRRGEDSRCDRAEAASISSPLIACNNPVGSRYRNPGAWCDSCLAAKLAGAKIADGHPKLPEWTHDPVLGVSGNTNTPLIAETEGAP